MEELREAIVEYLANDANLVNITGDDPSTGDYHIGEYAGDIPQLLPYISVRIGPTQPISDSNIQFSKSLVNITAHSTNPTISSKIIDLVRKLAIPEEVRGYMNVSNSRIANPSTIVKRRWPEQKADRPLDKDSDVWMDMLELEMIWSDVACRTNPYELEPAEYPDPQDERNYC